MKSKIQEIYRIEIHENWGENGEKRKEKKRENRSLSWYHPIFFSFLPSLLESYPLFGEHIIMRLSCFMVIGGAKVAVTDDTPLDKPPL
jgi:hypothetical protein